MADRDGDCVAIREALGLGKTVLATDCVKRPDECILWATGDSHRLRQLLGDLPTSHHPEVAPSSDDLIERIVEVYRLALGDKQS